MILQRQYSTRWIAASSYRSAKPFGRQLLIVLLAKTYLCAIEDEINKGATSALRVDVKRTNSHQTYITLTSFDAWAEEKGYRLRVLEPVPTITQLSWTPMLENTGLGIVEKNPRQRRFDALGVEIDEILLREPELTASQVMQKLRSQIGKPGTCVIGNGKWYCGQTTEGTRKN